MKKTILLVCLAFAMLLSGCGHTVKRVDSGTQMDLSGHWNDTDLRMASEFLIKECLTPPRLTSYYTTYGRLPVIIVGQFRNNSDEHIDTSILAQRLEASILSSGKAEFVVSGDLRNQIRSERADQQQGYTDDATMARLGREVGADFMLTGTVKTIVDMYDRTATRTYYITAELTDITTARRLWIGEYNEIKKVIKRPSARL
jgi:uncharacterized protein (TIGR02722 family)